MFSNGHTQHDALQQERLRQESAWGYRSRISGYRIGWDVDMQASRPSPSGAPDRLEEWPGIVAQRMSFYEQPNQTVLSSKLDQQPTALTEGFKKICERWRLDDRDMTRLLHLEEEPLLSALILSGKIPPLTGDIKDRMALVIGISIGLGDLFDDNRNGELKWLNSTRSEFEGLSPQSHMLKGSLSSIKDVVDLLDYARGLK